MTRLRVAYAPGFAMAAMLSAGIGCGTPGMPMDGGRDGSMETSLNDATGDRVDAGPTCNGVPIDNLNVIGTRAGTKTTFVGNNMAAPSPLTLGAQIPMDQREDCGDWQIGHQRIFEYTVQANSNLVITTTNRGTELDTAVIVLRNPCARGSRESVFCNDDDVRFPGEARTLTSGLVLGGATMGQKFYIAVGAYVPVGGTRDESQEVGEIELTVEEFPPVAEGMPCNPLGETVNERICATGLTCVHDRFPGTTGTCRTNGSVAGSRCNEAGMCPGQGLTCDPALNFCKTTVADGQPCNALFASCGMNSTCILRQIDQPTSVCAPNGTEGARCRATAGNECEAGLRCRRSSASSEGVCLKAAAMDGPCNFRTDVCPDGQDCVQTALSGSQGTCRNLGSAPGADCDMNGMCPGVNPGRCETQNNICLSLAATGAMCGGFTSCSTMTDRCVANDSTGVSGTCVVEGAAGGSCRQSSPACNQGLTCNTGAGVCVTAISTGGACAAPTSACSSGSACIREANGAFCRARGTPGAPCAGSATPCMGGATCSASNFPPDGICQLTAPMNGTCDPIAAATRCPGMQVCRATNATTATCIDGIVEDEANNNNNPSMAATPLTLPAGVRGTLSYFDTDCFTFDVTTAGSRLFALALQNTGNCFPSDLTLDFYTVTGPGLTGVSFIGTSSSGGPRFCPKIEGEVAAGGRFPWARDLQPGRYGVCVRNDRNDSLNYSLSINLLPAT